MRGLVTCFLFICLTSVCEAQSAGELRSLALLRLSRASLSAPSQESDSVHPPDTFLGPDKVKHFLMSGFIEAVGFSAMQLGGANRGTSLVAATCLTAATGIGREVHDGRTKGLFSLGDLLWDALGATSAILLISHTQR